MILEIARLAIRRTSRAAKAKVLAAKVKALAVKAKALAAKAKALAAKAKALAAKAENPPQRLPVPVMRHVPKAYFARTANVSTAWTWAMLATKATTAMEARAMKMGYAENMSVRMCPATGTMFGALVS